MTKLSEELNNIAKRLDIDIEQVVGKKIAFVLVVSYQNRAHYISSCTREDARDMLKCLVAKWESKESDIPDHKLD